MSIELVEQEHRNPLEVVEGLAIRNAWPFERTTEEELTILVRGTWTDQQVSFMWMPSIEALHLACAFEFKVPTHCQTEVLKLISMINQDMWTGHFDHWVDDGLIMYRNSLTLAGGLTACAQQCEVMLGTGLAACERYFPAFQFVVWAGKPAREALDVAMFETAGKA